MTSSARTFELLERLIAFDTTSRYSNLGIIDWIEAELAPLEPALQRIPNSTGDKSNLWVRIGPDRPGGLILSGHTDVVPVDGQDWHTDPFTMTEKDNRFYGRGTADMKSFLALCLAFAPAFKAANLSQPVHFAFSYDEEVGCQGAPDMIHQIVDRGAAPGAVWVGEPTNWRVVSGHKGIMLTEVEITGKEAHSSLPHLGVSAIGEAVELLACLKTIQADLIAAAPKDTPFEPPYPTMTVGEISGGTATNILARQCKFLFDLRCPPGFEPEQLLAPFKAKARDIDRQLKDRFPECGVRVTHLTNVPSLAAVPDNPAERLARAMTGDNTLRAATFATEAGQFHRAGIPAVVCGPGSIDQAHKPNEFIETAEITKGVDIFSKLVRHLNA
ncbi:MAG: acetylornithine deacetylase [Henriciella sp.]|nr:acetylornithine deacetylase [Henriciella sp.]